MVSSSDVIIYYYNYLILIIFLAALFYNVLTVAFIMSMFLFTSEYDDVLTF